MFILDSLRKFWSSIELLLTFPHRCRALQRENGDSVKDIREEGEIVKIATFAREFQVHHCAQFQRGHSPK